MTHKAFLLGVFLFFAFSSFTYEQDHHDDDALDFSGLVFVDAPAPDNEIKFYYSYSRDNAHGETTSDHTPRIEFEYAFGRSFGIEVNAPYTFHRSNVEPSRSHADTFEVSLKFASFALMKHSLLPTYGVSFNLPTGNRTGIGSNHITTIEPYVGLAYKHRRLEMVGIASVGFPIHTRHGDDGGKEFDLAIAALYKIKHRLQPLIEFETNTMLTGADHGESIVNIAPGIKYLPKNEHWQFGIGAGLPITSEREFKVRTVVSVFYRFH